MPRKMYTCTWAPTVFGGQQVTGAEKSGSTFPEHAALQEYVVPRVQKIEELGL